MYTCANCSVLACASEDRTKMPANCPMRNQEVLVEILKAYQEPENHEFYVKCSALEAEGYCQWPRLKETVELCKRMGYHKIGLAFCKGLRKEARVVADLLRSRGFETVVLLTQKRKSKDYKVEIEIPIDVDGSKTYTEEKSTYQNIKKFIKAKYGVNTHTKDIAEVKRDCGVEMRLNYNISKKENPKIRHCTQEKRGYIMDALEYYQVI